MIKMSSASDYMIAEQEAKFAARIGVTDDEQYEFAEESAMHGHVVIFAASESPLNSHIEYCQDCGAPVSVPRGGRIVAVEDTEPDDDAPYDGESCDAPDQDYPEPPEIDPAIFEPPPEIEDRDQLILKQQRRMAESALQQFKDQQRKEQMRIARRRHQDD